jgi:hypothetical protein
MRRSLVTAAFSLISASACATARPHPVLTTADSAAVSREVAAVTRANFELSRTGRYEESFERFAAGVTGAADGRLVLDWDAHRTRSVLPFLARLDSVVFELGEIVVTPISRDAAVVTGRYSFAASSDGQRLSNPSTAFSWIFARRDTRWEIVHWHISNP